MKPIQPMNRINPGYISNGYIPNGYIPNYTKLHISDVGCYRLDEDIFYYSPRYNRAVMILRGTVRDGASGAMDIRSLSWWVHDELCADGVWDDRTPVTNWQASCVLSDILHNEGRWFRARTWLFATYLLGCKNARKQGMFRRKKRWTKDENAIYLDKRLKRSVVLFATYLLGCKNARKQGMFRRKK